jgi:hypothetical protein
MSEFEQRQLKAIRKELAANLDLHQLWLGSPRGS